MNARHVPYLLLAVMTAGLVSWAACTRKPAPESTPTASTSETTAAETLSPNTNPQEKTEEKKMAAVDLTTDSSGLSKSTVVMTTTKGVIKYKFYSKDAPKTVARMVELIQQGFYNGLTFHRVVPGFVIQGGDPVGNGQQRVGRLLAS